jgi:hypothetical protein
MKAILDGDIFIYRVGFTCNDEPEGIAIARMSSFMEDLLMLNDFEHYQGYLTGKGNFRFDVAKTLPYKGNRTAPKPVHYALLREYLVKGWDFHMVEGQEADDAIGIDAYSYQSTGDYCIVSIDKDLDMIRGWHLNFVKNERYFIDESQTLKHFYKQILTGDRVDNIAGIKGIGTVKADKLLADTTTEDEMYAAVLKAYDGNEERVIENGKLLWIRRKENEVWLPPTHRDTLNQSNTTDNKSTTTL